MQPVRHLTIIGLFSNGIGKNEWCTIFYIYKETKAKESEITVLLIESFPQMKYEEMEAEDSVSTVIQLVFLGFSWGFLTFQTSKGYSLGCSPSFTSLSQLEIVS